MKRLSAVLLAAALFVVATQAQTRRVDPRAYLEHIKFLASDDLEGRGNGSPGLEAAAEYIAKHFRAAGLEPAGDTGTFFQRFEMITGLSIQPGNAVTLNSGRSTVEFEIGRDYQLVSTSSDPSSPGQQLPIVFAGYGISAPSLHYDDYSAIDAAGKAVLIFTHEPQENDPKSAFEGQTNTVHASMMRKVEMARSHGAKAMLVIDDPNHRPALDRFRRWLTEPQAEEYGLPVFYLSRDRVQRALGIRLNLESVSNEIDRDFAPKSRALSDLTVNAVDRSVKIRRPVRNVIGILRGSDAVLRDEFVIIGAHYDHLGRSGRFSMAQNSTGQIHHGADDNASGTAAVIEMARAATESRKDFRRSLLFMTFAGEEHGLLGSSHYVNHPSMPLDRTVAMINLDMVGRTAGRILVDGLANAPSIDEDLKAAESSSPLNMKALRGGPGAGASDDATFLLRKIPAINFFSGFHPDYHRPDDTWEKIDAAGGAAVADLALALARQLANRSERPPFVDTAPQDSHSSGSVGAVFDFTFALREKKPGDKVDVTVLRDGKPITATVELTNRP